MNTTLIESGVNVIRTPTLPNEVILEFMNYLPLETLLTCRQVSQNWNYEALRTCRNHRVKLNYIKWYNNPVDLLSIFLESSIPWSSHTFVSRCPLININHTTPECEKSIMSNEEYNDNFRFFLDIYGQELKHFTCIGGKFVFNFDFLQNMQNLKVFKHVSLPFSADPHFKEITSFVSCVQLISSTHNCLLSETSDYYKNPLSPTPRLKFFRKFAIDVIGICDPLVVADFIRNQPVLEEVHLNYSMICDKDFSKTDCVLTVIMNLFRISIELDYSEDTTTIVQTLLDKNICIRKLSVNVFHMPLHTGHQDYYANLQELLSANSNNLVKLELKSYQLNPNMSGNRPPIEVRLRIPGLLKLKSLNFDINETLPSLMQRNKDISWIPFGYPYEVNESNQFPILRKVEFINYMPYSKFDVIYETETVHESVTELILVREKRIPDIEKFDWGRLFPNLKILKTRVNARNLCTIFSTMQNLQQLDLVIDTVPGIVDMANINFIMSGIHDPLMAEASELTKLELQKGLAQGRLPSLLNLNSLRSLKLHFAHSSSLTREEIFDDTGATAALLPLQPLCNLELHYVQISPECVQKLEHRHDIKICRQLDRGTRLNLYLNSAVK